MLSDVRKKTAALLVAAVFLLCGCGKAYAFVMLCVKSTGSSNLSHGARHAGISLIGKAAVC